MTKSKSEVGFGFRELHAFNSAMLAVMAARIISEPGNLWVQVMKGIYFPSSHFFKAAKGGEPPGAGPASCMAETSSNSRECGRWGMASL